MDIYFYKSYFKLNNKKQIEQINNKIEHSNTLINDHLR